nr:uncharacterized protein LOC115853243 [Globicephala melas]
MRGAGKVVLGTGQDLGREASAAAWEPVRKHPVGEEAHALWPRNDGPRDTSQRSPTAEKTLSCGIRRVWTAGLSVCWLFDFRLPGLDHRFLAIEHVQSQCPALPSLELRPAALPLVLALWPDAVFVWSLPLLLQMLGSVCRSRLGIQDTQAHEDRLHPRTEHARLLLSTQGLATSRHRHTEEACAVWGWTSLWPPLLKCGRRGGHPEQTQSLRLHPSQLSLSHRPTGDPPSPKLRDDRSSLSADIPARPRGATSSQHRQDGPLKKTFLSIFQGATMTLSARLCKLSIIRHLMYSPLSQKA